MGQGAEEGIKVGGKGCREACLPQDLQGSQEWVNQGGASQEVNSERCQANPKGGDLTSDKASKCGKKGDFNRRSSRSHQIIMISLQYYQNNLNFPQ